MSATVIDGKQVAARVQEEVAREVAQLKEEGLTPGLAVVLVGDDPASQVYTANKERTARELGMHSVLHRLPATASQDEVAELVQRLNRDPAIHGILVQSPLPGGLDIDAVVRLIDPLKDVDGFHPENVGRLWLGQDGLLPCTPAGVMRLLQEYGVDPKGKHAVVVGRSNIVGKPMAALLLRAHATVTVCHSRTPDLKETCRRADILVAAVGKLQMITGEYVKPGAVVIDVGINPVPGYKRRIRGDVDFDSAAEVAGLITPVPGGVGPMTIAMLMANTVKAALLQRGR